jgi:hypothetical protein
MFSRSALSQVSASVPGLKAWLVEARVQLLMLGHCMCRR